MTKGLQNLGQWTIEKVLGSGKSFILLFDILCTLPLIFKRFSLIIRQLYFVGVMSLPIIVVSGFFVGMVLAFQGYSLLSRFGADSALGTAVAVSILRELGPVITGLLFAGRAGSAITAEIGLMKTTGQISSLEMMAVSPVNYVYFPRFIAAVVALPLLTMIFCAVAVLGGYVVGVVQLSVDSGSFWSEMQSTVSFHTDIFEGVIIKSVTFGFLCSLISVYQGYNCMPTSEGIGRATTRTVVVSSLAILGFDFLLTASLFGI